MRLLVNEKETSAESRDRVFLPILGYSLIALGIVGCIVFFPIFQSDRAFYLKYEADLKRTAAVEEWYPHALEKRLKVHRQPYHNALLCLVLSTFAGVTGLGIAGFCWLRRSRNLDTPTSSTSNNSTSQEFLLPASVTIIIPLDGSDLIDRDELEEALDQALQETSQGRLVQGQLQPDALCIRLELHDLSDALALVREVLQNQEVPPLSHIKADALAKAINVY